MKKAIIASTSTLHNGKYLDYLTPTLKDFLAEESNLLFIPFARPGGISHDEYTEKVAHYFETFKITVKGLHTYESPEKAIAEAACIFTGGGNTFVLVDMLYKLNLMPSLKNAINKGCKYIGTSAGSNICGLSMQTTNDMPIVYPKSFTTLGIVPFNINPHYLDPDPNSKHMGETRETRIKEFHAFNTQAVIGLREGSWLEVEDDVIYLRGNLTARIFEQNKTPYEIEPNSLINF